MITRHCNERQKNMLYLVRTGKLNRLHAMKCARARLQLVRAHLYTDLYEIFLVVNFYLITMSLKFHKGSSFH